MSTTNQPRIEEKTMATKFSARLTTRFIDRRTPEFTGASRMLTARQIVEEYRDLRRGGTFVGVEALAADGARVSIGDLEEMAEEDDDAEAPEYTPDMPTAREWAASATAGDYLVEYEDTGMTAEDDPGSRCGYDDQQLDEIRQILARRDLQLDADDRGLVAQTRVRE